jgi:hypothetical protein
VNSTPKNEQASERAQQVYDRLFVLVDSWVHQTAIRKSMRGCGTSSL